MAKGQNYYSGETRFYVSVDCVVLGLHEGCLKLLLIKRNFEPCKGELSLIGGFVREGESVSEAAERVLKSLTGLEGTYMRQTGAFGDVDRDPGERVISVGYASLVNFNDIDHRVLAEHDARWVNVAEMPVLSFDHNEMVKRAIESVRKRFMTEPLAFRMLPEQFTLTQMQNLYETVLGKPIDKRNFRRRVLENPSIVETGEIDKVTSRRGAKLYRYSPHNIEAN